MQAASKTSLEAESKPILLPSRFDWNEQRALDELSAQQLDIWEHAALLYHAYDWQTAADTFYMLALDIESVERRALCFLNAGLIQARLGDYEAAAATFEEAASISQTFLVTTFLIGLVSQELRDEAKAEACFELCYDGLVYGAFDHNDVGMDFILDKPMVHNNIRSLRSAQFSASFLKAVGGNPAAMDSVPAEYIFEAPPRDEAAAEDVTHQQRNRHSGFQKLFGSKRSDLFKSVVSPKIERRLQSPLTSNTLRSLGPYPLSPPSVPPHEKLSTDLVKRGPDQPHAPSSGEWLRPDRSPTSPISPLSSGHGQLSSIPETAGIVSSTARMSGILGSSAPTSGPALSDRRMSWHPRPSTPYVARDARGERKTTKELARFIRTGVPHKLVPRNAEGEREPVEELARFIRHYAPDDLQHETARPLVLDPYLIATMRMEKLLNEQYDDADHFSPSKGAMFDKNAKPLVDREHRSSAPASSRPNLLEELSQRHSSLSAESEPRSSMLKISETPLELLQPAVYSPTRPARQEVLGESDNIAISSEQPASKTPSTSASSGNSYYKHMSPTERVEKGRDHALRLLEGRVDGKSGREWKALMETLRDKPLPPKPDGTHSTSPLRFAESPNSVATENFFDKVLQKRS
ncbi:hypothetical protein LTR37_000176 [Vermiconidia calcicola]|uniref:Uncharacterized protein n=1 Tax=Vermiconidia calcicola TaxID=1690605 RepID=A0ACC3P0P3_9PEZI|nr:hypothetical protein LTR37_000176 [Vermiconidia calcicola]